MFLEPDPHSAHSALGGSWLSHLRQLVKDTRFLSPACRRFSASWALVVALTTSVVAQDSNVVAGCSMQRNALLIHGIVGRGYGDPVGQRKNRQAQTYAD